MADILCFLRIDKGVVIPLFSDGVLQKHLLVSMTARHTASVSLSGLLSVIRREYPASGKNFGQAVSSVSRSRIRPIGEFL